MPCSIRNGVDLSTCVIQAQTRLLTKKLHNIVWDTQTLSHPAKLVSRSTICYSMQTRGHLTSFSAILSAIFFLGFTGATGRSFFSSSFFSSSSSSQLSCKRHLTSTRRQRWGYVAKVMSHQGQTNYSGECISWQPHFLPSLRLPHLRQPICSRRWSTWSEDQARSYPRLWIIRISQRSCHWSRKLRNIAFPLSLTPRHVHDCDLCKITNIIISRFTWSLKLWSDFTWLAQYYFLSQDVSRIDFEFIFNIFGRILSNDRRFYTMTV